MLGSGICWVLNPNEEREGAVFVFADDGDDLVLRASELAPDAGHLIPKAVAFATCAVEGEGHLVSSASGIAQDVIEDSLLAAREANRAIGLRAAMWTLHYVHLICSESISVKRSRERVEIT